MILTLAVNKWKLCLHNVIKRVDGNRKSVANTKKERKFDKTFEENFMQKVPETLALQTMKQTLCRIIKKLETLINTGFLLGNTWQHPKIPKSSPSNIAETPENAASALPEASLGEDKYFPIF